MDNQSLLDEMVSEDSIEMLKAALPYLSPQGQSFISVFAKFLELKIHSGSSGLQPGTRRSAPSPETEQILWKCSQPAAVSATAGLKSSWTI